LCHDGGGQFLKLVKTPIPSDCKKFRTAVLPVFGWLLVFVLLGIFGFVGYLLKVEGPHLNRPALEKALVFGSVVAVAGTFVEALMFSLFFPVCFTAEGVHGHSGWGIRRFIRWQDIAAVRTFGVFNLKWLRIFSTADRKVIWLPLFQASPAGFREEIRRLAPPESPLLKHL
jgi:hypothetical protein